MIEFFIGLMIGFIIGYPMGLFLDKWDKRIKNGGR
jgi:ABC-type dipeptide/oligopeptide/nickel transport system permease subunit